MDVSIVIPAYNEQQNLPALLDDIERLVLTAPCGVEVLVVDDGSTDQTAELVRRGAETRPWLSLVVNPGNRGMGAALKHGTQHARQPMVVWVMADRSDRLEDIWEMRRRLMDGADLVVASRAMHGGSYGEFKGLKPLGSRLFSLFAKIVLGLPVNDCTNAFRAFRRERFAELTLLHDDFAVSPELVFQGHLHGWRVDQVPTMYFYRQGGSSNFHLLRMGWRYLTLTIRLLLARIAGAD